MNADAERLVKEQADPEYINALVDVLKRVSEQLDYLIEILE